MIWSRKIKVTKETDEILGSQGGVHEDRCLLGCCAMFFDDWNVAGGDIYKPETLSYDAAGN